MASTLTTNRDASPHYTRYSIVEAIERITPSFFGISTGLAGLAGVWRIAASFYAIPLAISVGLYLCAAIVYLVLLGAYIAKIMYHPSHLIADLTDPVLAPFCSLCPISGLLLSGGLLPFNAPVATALFLFFFVLTLVLGSWMTGQWIIQNLTPQMFHPGYFLPTVAGGFIAADTAVRFGYPVLGWFSFGFGAICWAMLGSIIFNRLLFTPALAPRLVPTLAVVVAPPVVGGLAYFGLNGERVDTLAYLLAGYAALMIVVQIRLLPIYLRLHFEPSFWSFTFPYGAVIVYAIRWLEFEHVEGREVIGMVLVAAITCLIGVIALRSLVALSKGAFFPAATRQ